MSCNFFIIFQVLLLNFIFYPNVYSQQCWEVFSDIRSINEVKSFEDYTYVGTYNGLYIINKLNGTEQHITTAGTELDGIGINHIEIIPDGTIWLGNTSGLYYYEEDKLHKYRLSTVDFGVRLLTSTDNEIAVIYNEGTSPFTTRLAIINAGFTILDEEISDLAYKTLKYGNGQLWLTSQNELIQWNTDGNSIITTIPDINGEPGLIRDHHVDSTGTHWITAWYPNAYVIWSTDLTTWNEIRTTSLFENIFEVNRDEIYFSSSQHVARYSPNDSLLIQNNIELFSKVPPLSGDRYNVHSIENDSVFWVSGQLEPTKNTLYHLIEQDTIGYISTDFRSNDSEDILSDCDGNFITLNEDYIQKYDGKFWQTIDIVYTTSDCKLTNIALNPETCQIWGYSRNCSSLWIIDEEVNELDSILEHNVVDLEFDEKGNTYIGSWFHIFKLDSTGVLIDLSQDSLSGTSDLLYGSDGSLWSTGYDGVQRLKNGIWEYFDIVIHWSNRTWLYEDNHDNVWLYSGRFIHRFNGVEWQQMPVPEITSTLLATSMVQDHNDSYWIATKDGLIEWDLTNHYVYDELNTDMLLEFCVDLEISRDSSLWIKHYRNISKLNLKDNLISNSNELGDESINTGKIEYSIFPNPSIGHLNISNVRKRNRHIQIFTLSGNLIMDDKSREVSYQVFLEPGLYWVKIREKNKVIVEQVYVI